MPNCSFMTNTRLALAVNTVETHWDVTQHILFDFSISIQLHYIIVRPVCNFFFFSQKLFWNLLRDNFRAHGMLDHLVIESWLGVCVCV